MSKSIGWRVPLVVAAASVVLLGGMSGAAAAQTQAAKCSYGVTSVWLKNSSGAKYAIAYFTNNLNCTGVDAVYAQDPTSDGKWVVASLVVITSGASSGPSASSHGHDAPYSTPWAKKSLRHGVKYELEVASYNTNGLQDAGFANVNS
jgi:hypothetical protein